MRCLNANTVFAELTTAVCRSLSWNFRPMRCLNANTVLAKFTTRSVVCYVSQSHALRVCQGMRPQSYPWNICTLSYSECLTFCDRTIHQLVRAKWWGRKSLLRASDETIVMMQVASSTAQNGTKECNWPKSRYWAELEMMGKMFVDAQRWWFGKISVRMMSVMKKIVCMRLADTK
jgi:hypothetical protein